ncbi:MAG: type IIL restriction-modification enzyme MmeI [Bacteroidota bacterium]|nr:type IIL restriction-modification enzyme MmeI [Bacteroidota bacterium]
MNHLQIIKVNVRTKNLTIIDERKFKTEKIIFKNTFDYIIGNPPFIGSAYQNEAQKRDMDLIFSGLKSYGMLDYVAAWYKKAAQLIMNTKTKVAFVSTNSITQGEQPGILWTILYNLYKVKIHFAHRTFSWRNEAKGNAAVHVVIIGFANYDVANKTIYEYERIKGEPQAIKVKNINPYLVEGKDIVLLSLAQPICHVPKMQSGSAARDGGFLILKDDEKKELVSQNQSIEKYLSRFISGDDIINNIVRWCIWLKNATPSNIRSTKEFQERFKKVKEFREKSTRGGTKKMAELPFLFAEERQPESDFLVIPKVSSENRRYIPIAYLTKDYIVSDKTFVVPNTTLFHFGILTSTMHMAWMRATCGRLESRYSYSNTIVYNNFPWPFYPGDRQVKVIEKAAQKVLDARLEFPKSSLADLYDPLTMPLALVKAHNELDKAVDLAYRPQPFTSEANRIVFLFELYEKYTADLFTKVKVKKNTITYYVLVQNVHNFF